MSTSLLLADDQELMRMAFRMVIDTQPDMSIVGEAGNGHEAVAAAERLRPDVVLMDVRMPEMDGVEATRLIVESASSARIIILTTFDLDEYVYAALRAGASGFLLKDTPPADLLSGDTRGRKRRRRRGAERHPPAAVHLRPSPPRLRPPRSQPARAISSC